MSRFVIDGFARSIARTWRYHAASAALLLGGAVVAYFAASQRHAGGLRSFDAGRFAGCPVPRPSNCAACSRRAASMEGGVKFFFASFLFAHNLKVGLMSLCIGVLAGVPTIFLLLYNGMLLGAFTALHHRAGIYADYWAWILPHGITEISAIVHLRRASA